MNHCCNQLQFESQINTHHYWWSITNDWNTASLYFCVCCSHICQLNTKLVKYDDAQFQTDIGTCGLRDPLLVKIMVYFAIYRPRRPVLLRMRWTLLSMKHCSGYHRDSSRLAQRPIFVSKSAINISWHSKKKNLEFPNS